MQPEVLPILLLVACVVGLGVVFIVLGNLFNPKRPGRTKRMPYESGMDPIHDTRRPLDVRFHLMAIAFLVFDVELLFLYPWAVASRPAVDPSQLTQSAPAGVDAAVAAGLVDGRGIVFAGAMLFIGLLTLGFIYDWRKGIFRWR